MKSAGLSELPSFDTSFREHRSNRGSQKLALDLSLSKTTPAPNWAPLPSPPMSGSPPSEDSPKLPPVAGRRRKRSTTPPKVTTGQPSPLQVSPEQGPSSRQAIQQRKAPELATAALATPSYPSSYPSTQSFGYGPGGPSILSSATAHLDPRPDAGDISPRATRKTKAHVASACVNCKKKHLRCDNARPCRRCVQSGKEVSCIDVEHKKRGRPPLKPEESQSRKSFETAMSPLQGHLAGFGRLPNTHSSSYIGQRSNRGIRPGPGGSGSDIGRPVFPRPAAPLQATYAQPTISPSSATATGTMSRPLQSSLAGYSQPPYPMTQSAGMTALGQDSFPNYVGSYPYLPPQQSPPYTLFPRTSSQMQPPLLPTSRSGYRMAGMQDPDLTLQLPPILPAPPGAGIDPAMAQQQRQVQYQQQSRVEPPGGNGTTRQPDPKRPKISDILRND